MRKITFYVCALIVSVSVLFFGVSEKVEAKSYIQKWNLVKGKDLHWRNISKYTTQLNASVKTWNNHSKGTIKTYNQGNTDVAVSDYSENSSVGGVTSSNGTIKLNKKQMDKATAAQKENVTTHEFGHALGLDHSTKGNVMYKNVSGTKKLGQNDKDSFKAAKKKWK